MKPTRLFLLVVLFLAACTPSTTLKPAPTAQAIASFGMPTATPKLSLKLQPLLLCCPAHPAAIGATPILGSAIPHLAACQSLYIT